MTDEQRSDDEVPAGFEEPGRPDASGPDPAESDGLLSRLRVIEDQPLASRAEAFNQLHDELRAGLEAGDTARPGDARDA